MKPPETITTERLILRKPRMGDAPAIFETYAQDPEVTRYLIWAPHKNVHETERFLSECEQSWRAGSDFAFAILLKEEDRLIGMLGLHPAYFKLQGAVEVGYVLARPYWGVGYMTEAVRSVVAWAFTQPEIYRVQALCDVENTGSARVMEKAGLTREGLLRRYVLHPNLSADPRDAYMYAIVR